MTDYISRETLENWVREEVASLDSKDDREFVIQRWRKEIPAADVAPVVHGWWEHGREVSREYTGSVITCIFYEDWHCSACGYTIDDRWYSAITYKHCPNCGAKMGGETREGPDR